MKREEVNQHLSQISTAWSMLRKAHEGSDSEANAAQKMLMDRYGGAVHRYLVKLLGDVHAADDLLQEFALALMKGSFRGANREKQHFRYYVKSVLFHLVSKYRKRQQKQERQLAGESDDLANYAVHSEDHDREFNENWRDELLAKTWEALKQTQPTFYQVLRFRAEHPKTPSAEMAAQLSQELGKPLTEQGVRQSLHRAREKFSDLLLDSVADSLENPTLADVEEELAALNLLDYCRPALQRRNRS